MDRFPVLVLYFIMIKCIDGTIHLKEKYFWSQLDYEYPAEYLRQQALNSGEFQPENLLPLGIERFREKLFITIPRWRDGVPATLNYIDTIKTPSGSPKLIPYPSWRDNRFGDCENGLQYAFRLSVDKCKRLWVYDAGFSGTFMNKTKVCLPALFIFDLETNRRILRYEFNPEDTRDPTLLAHIVVDVGQTCDETYAYLADPLAFKMIVYSLKENQSWRFDHAYFYPDPLKADFNIAGLNYQWQVGVLSMTLSEPKPDGYRTLYFTSVTSHRNFNVSTRVLRDKNRVTNSYNDFHVMNERGINGHVISQVIDEYSGVMMFSLIDQYAIGCWHTSKPYFPENFDLVDYDEDNLVFQSDIKIDENRKMWVISNKMPIFFLSKLNNRDINFRIFSTSIDEMIENTRCQQQPIASVHNRIENDFTSFSKPTNTNRYVFKNDGYPRLGNAPRLSTDINRSSSLEWWIKSLWDRN